MKTREFHRPCEAVRDEVLNYTDCGLDNIFLLNGFEREVIDGEEYVSISDIDGLHRAIGLHIVLDKKAPTGQEMRFLRTEMGLSQAELGKLLGVSDQSVARWEKGKTDVPGTAVFSFKVMYVLSLVPESMRAGILDEFKSGLERLSEEDETEDSIRLCYDNRGWGDPDKFAA
jgi:DNA-binding transcriptional regulator YiaG